jgi:hypothetical protein
MFLLLITSVNEGIRILGLSSIVAVLRTFPFPGNRNAQKGIVLPDWLKLDSAESILKFMRQILIPYTLSGQLGTRASSA